MVPGTLTSAERIRKGLIGFTSPSGRTYDPGIEALAMFSGHRIQDIDIAQGLGYRASDFARDMDKATDIYRRLATSRGTVKAGELEEKRRQSEQARRRTFDRFKEVVDAARLLGVSKSTVRKELESRGLSVDTIKSLESGAYRPYELTRGMRDRAKAQGRLQLIKAIEK